MLAIEIEWWWEQKGNEEGTEKLLHLLTQEVLLQVTCYGTQ